MIKDGNGQLLKTISKDVFGNTVVKTEEPEHSTTMSGDSVQFDDDGNLSEDFLLKLILENTK